MAALCKGDFVLLRFILVFSISLSATFANAKSWQEATDDVAALADKYATTVRENRQ